MNADKHLTQTFEAAERAHPDLMEPYSTRLVDAQTNAEKIEVMRAGLRETICTRVPLHELSGVGAEPDRQGALAL